LLLLLLYLLLLLQQTEASCHLDSRRDTLALQLDAQSGLRTPYSQHLLKCLALLHRQDTICASSLLQQTLLHLQQIAHAHIITGTCRHLEILLEIPAAVLWKHALMRLQKTDSKKVHQHKHLDPANICFVLFIETSAEGHMLT